MPEYKYPARQTIDIDSFAPWANNPEVLYGLPAEIKFCASCVVSNQRPNSTVEFTSSRESKKTTICINEDGVCDPCHYATAKHDDTDWVSREKELGDLCDRFRSRDGSYDCLAPGSGGKDSIYAAHVLKTQYGMNPLTVTWAPNIYTDWGWRNLQGWVHSGFDNHLVTPNGHLHRLITRVALENLYHPFQPFILGQKNLAPKIAAQLGIPLVFYGENEAEYGNARTENIEPTRSYDYFASADQSGIRLGGMSLKDFESDFGIKPGMVEIYLPADPDKLATAGVEIHYLGYYLKWHPQSCYYYSVEHADFIASPERTPGTYSKYNSIDDRLDDLHYYTTFIKFGIGRATYDAAQEIRSRDITREEGVVLVKRFDGEFPERFFDELLAYLSLPPNEFPEAAPYFEQPAMDRAYFDNLTDRHRSPHLWAYENGKWRLRHTVHD